MVSRHAATRTVSFLSRIGHCGFRYLLEVVGLIIVVVVLNGHSIAVRSVSAMVSTGACL